MRPRCWRHPNHDASKRETEYCNRLRDARIARNRAQTRLDVPDSRASNAARAALVVANVTPTGYRVGVFMANKARFATAADRRRNVAPGEIFCYWPQAKIAADLGCSERQVSRGVRSLREAGTLEVRRRVRPCEASYVWVQPVGSGVVSDGEGVVSGVGSGVVSGVVSHTEPRTEPKKNQERSSATRARVVCPDCGHDWPDKPEYGTTCYRCPQPTAAQLRRREQRKRDRLSEQDPPAPPDKAPATRPDPPPLTPERQAQLEADAVENGYHKRDDGSWTKGPEPPQAAPTPPPAETETRPPPEDTEPGPEQRRFKEELAKWTKGKRRWTTP